MIDLLLADEAWPHHWWFLIFPLIWLIAIALVIRFVCMGRGARSWSRGSSPRRAEGILAERYALGEIGDDEYRTRREHLRADAQT